MKGHIVIQFTNKLTLPVGWWTCLWSFAVLAATAVQAADPLYLSRPFDEITLDQNNAGVRLKVQPLRLPGRKLPAESERQDDLEIELLDRAGERYRLGWNNIVTIRFFEELVLAEAVDHVQQGRFDEAYPYFQFLEAKYPQTAGLKNAVEDYLWAQIGSDEAASRHQAALALLIELHERSPQRPGLDAAFQRVTTKLTDEQLAAGNFRAVRGLLKNLTQRFPQAATTAETYAAQLQEKAQQSLTRASQTYAAGDYRSAHAAVQQAINIWPEIGGGFELAREIHDKYPVVVVGVTKTSISPHTSAPEWSARRTQPLISPTLFERFTPVGDQPPYRSPVGELADSKDPRQVVFRLYNGANRSAPLRHLSAHDVARLLCNAADPGQDVFAPAWRDLLQSVDVPNQDEVHISLQRPAMRAAAWLTIPLGRGGGYRCESATQAEVIFVRQAAGPGAQSVPPSEIVERTFPNSAAALRALKRGEVSVVDRISPWELSSIAADGPVIVGRYALPSVHVLVPNPQRPLAANRTLKRAILYGIDRESILKASLLAGQNIAGCQVVSGPFPRGESKNDPHGYGYDEELPVRPYDPGLALALASVAAEEHSTRGDSKEKGAAVPPLILGHAAEPIPRIACQSIALQLRAARIPVELREVSDSGTIDERCDLQYVELAMQEPLVDAWRLFAPDGVLRPISPAMRTALRELEGAADWLQASERLQAIHRLAAAELPVIPLWQLVDHYAFHNSVAGIRPRTTTLYQDVDQWQVKLRIPSE